MTAATVTTSNGALQGEQEGGVAVFRGIPYARPPVGSLRFAPPQPPEPWSGTRDATRFGPASLQAMGEGARVMGLGDVPQEEDCLYLNVWTPAADGGRRPVMVFIHGGAFILGASSQPLYRGAALSARGDVVVVTLNYRLGAFGFLRLRDLPGSTLDSTGNEALLDMIAALTWVRNEIAAFGGDPDNVTVFGESAGAICTSALLVSPKARGLFHKMILQSGSLNVAVTPQEASALAAQYLAALGLGPEDAATLRDLPVQQLREAQHKVVGLSLAAVTAGKATTNSNFAPVADGDVVPLAPFEAAAAGAAAGIPLLAGTNRDEWRFFAALDPTIASLNEDGLRDRLAQLVPGAGPQNISHAQQALETYRSARSARGEGVTPPELWLAILTDYVFRRGTTRLLERHAAHAPAYGYLFTWASPAFGGLFGSAHALDLPFVFGVWDDPWMATVVPAGEKERALSARIQDAWLAFARTGNPASEGMPAWPAYTPGKRQTMRLDAELAVLEAPQEPERAFWDTLTWSVG